MARHCVHAALARWPRRRHWIERLAKPKLNLVRPKKSVERHLWIAFVESRPRRVDFQLCRHAVRDIRRFFWKQVLPMVLQKKNFCSTPNAAISCGECGPKKHASNFPDVEEDVSSQITETKNFFCLGGRQGFSVTKLSAANFRRGEKRRRPLFFLT